MDRVRIGWNNEIEEFELREYLSGTDYIVLSSDSILDNLIKNTQINGKSVEIGVTVYEG